MTRGPSDLAAFGDSFEPAFVSRLGEAISGLAAAAPSADLVVLEAAPSTISLLLVTCSRSRPGPALPTLDGVDVHLRHNVEVAVDEVLVSLVPAGGGLRVFDAPGLSSAQYELYARLRCDGLSPSRARDLVEVLS